MLFSLLVTVAFIPGLTGGAIPTGWVVLWLAMPLLLIEHCKIVMTPVHWLGLAFLCYAALSLAWSPNGLLRFMQLVALGAVFAWASDLPGVRRVIKGIALGLGVSGLVTVAQWCGLEPVSVASGSEYAGLFVNRNLLAETTAMMVILLLAYQFPPYWLIVTLPGLIHFSRTSLLALAVAGTFALWSYSRKAAVAVMAAGGSLVAALIVVSPNSTNERWAIWSDTWQGLSWFGHGVGSFDFLFPKFAQRIDVLAARPQHAHNELLELMFELGVGVIPLVLMVLLLLRVDDVGRIALIGFLIIAAFGFPLSTPVTAFMAAVLAGHLSRRVSVVRWHGLDGRSALSIRVPS